MGEVLMSCVVCGPEQPVFSVPVNQAGMDLILGHLQAEHSGELATRREDQIVHVHLAGNPARAAYQTTAAPEPQPAPTEAAGTAGSEATT